MKVVYITVFSFTVFGFLIFTQYQKPFAKTGVDITSLDATACELIVPALKVQSMSPGSTHWISIIFRSMQRDGYARVIQLKRGKECPACNVAYDQYYPWEIKSRDKLWVINQFGKPFNKTYLYDLYKTYFGHDIRVNPIKYSGKIYRKPDLPSRPESHIILQGPLSPEKVDKDKIYQKFIVDERYGNSSEYIIFATRSSPCTFNLLPIRLTYSRSNRDSLTQTGSIVPIEELFPGDLANTFNRFLNELCLDYARVDFVFDTSKNFPVLFDVVPSPVSSWFSHQFESEIVASAVSGIYNHTCGLAKGYNKQSCIPCRSR